MKADVYTEFFETICLCLLCDEESFLRLLLLQHGTTETYGTPEKELDRMENRTLNAPWAILRGSGSFWLLAKSEDIIN